MPTSSSRINPRSPVPKYTQLRDILLALITDRLAVDEPIPSERELAERYDVARLTARQAIDELVRDGRLYRVAGRGTFVARPKTTMPLQLTSFSEDMRARGMRPGARDLGRRTAPAAPRIAKVLLLEPGAPVHVIERLRTADDAPMAIERLHIAAHVAPALLQHALENQSLYALLEKQFGVLLDAGEQTIEAANADPADAALLGLPDGAAVLMFERRSLSSGTPVEYAVSTYRGDRYQLRATFDTPSTARSAS